MPKLYKHIGKTIQEHATHAVIAGSIAVLTGFAPEKWFERLLHVIYVPERIRLAFDFRIAFVLVGVGIIVGDVIYRQRRRLETPPAPTIDQHNDSGSLVKTVPTSGAFGGEDTKPATASAGTGQLPDFGDRPAIAVLAFNNMSGDPEQEYFADGISEDLIAAFSSWCRFPVIARNSTFAYKGRSLDIKTIGQELGARYLLEGSVRKSGNRVRVTAQLIDASTGHHVWADRYDRDINDIFAIQDEITTNIAAAIEPELDQMEERRAFQSTKTSLAAYDLVQRGNWHHNKFTTADSEEAQRLYAAAIEADPNYAPTYAAMAYTMYWSAQMRWAKDGPTTLQKAHDFARKAVALDNKDARAHMYLGQISLWLHRYDDAITETRRAIELNPSLAQAYSVLGYALDCVGEFDEAIKTVNHSLRLRPQDRTLARCIPAIALAHYELGAYDAAEDVARRAVTINPIYWIGHQVLAASLGQLGRKEEAAQKIAEIRQREPNISLASYSRRLPFRDPIHAKRIEDGLIKAGWTDT